MGSFEKTLPFLINYLPEDSLKTAEIELKETPEKTTCLIRDLTEMAKRDKSLQDIEFHPDFLLQFLRHSKHRVNIAFKRLQKYINLRRKISSYFTGLQDKISSEPTYSWVSPLPWRSREGCAMIVLKFGLWNSVVSFENLNRIVHLVLHQSLRNPMTQIHGLKLILDFEDTTFRHLRHINPGSMYQVVQMYLECTPARFKSFHCVNCSMPMKLAWSLIKPFMPEKLRKRVLFHKHVDELMNYFPKHTLPVEYGGEIRDFYMHSWMKEASDQMGLSTLSGQQNTF